MTGPWFAACRRWYAPHRFVFWIHGRWEWGWLGNGWNRLALGKVAIYLPARSKPYVRTHGFLDD